MKRIIRISSLLLIGAVAPAFAATGAAEVAATSAASNVSGSFKLADTEKGLSIKGQLSGLKPGKHAFHVHEFGSCADTGKAAGDHYNPAGHPHGNTLKDGQAKAHAGDMGNLEVGKDGKVEVDLVVPGLTLAGDPPSAAGRALVVHEKADDFGQPTGNAGGRVGCGTIIVSGN